MSMTDTLKIIHELGGKATTKQIRELAKNKYPGMTKFITRRLAQLLKWDMITYEDTFPNPSSRNKFRFPDMTKRIWIINYEDAQVAQTLQLAPITNIS